MATDAVREIGDHGWERVVEKSGKPVAVMFFSPTCPHCVQMEPAFEEYAQELSDTMTFVRVNVTQSLTIASRYGVMSTPTFKFFCKGRPVQELVGATYPSLIKKTAEEVLKKGEECIGHSSAIDYSISGYA